MSFLVRKATDCSHQSGRAAAAAAAAVADNTDSLPFSNIRFVKTKSKKLTSRCCRFPKSSFPYAYNYFAAGLQSNVWNHPCAPARLPHTLMQPLMSLWKTHSTPDLTHPPFHLHARSSQSVPSRLLPYPITSSRQACLTSPVLPPHFLVHQDCSCISHAQVQPLDIEERYEDTSHHFLVSKSPDVVGMRNGGWWGSHPVVTSHYSPCVTHPKALLAGATRVSWLFYLFIFFSFYRQQTSILKTATLVKKCLEVHLVKSL